MPTPRDWLALGKRLREDILDLIENPPCTHPSEDRQNTVSFGAGWGTVITVTCGKCGAFLGRMG